MQAREVHRRGAGRIEPGLDVGRNSDSVVQFSKPNRYENGLGSGAMVLAHNPRALRTLRALEHFLSADLVNVLERHKRSDPALAALELFQDAALAVPAYARFLSERGVDPRAIVDVESFRRLPTTSKADYHRAYPLADLCRSGRLSEGDFIAVSSGSTGEPTFWPRAQHDEFGTAFRFEQVLAGQFDLARKRTLGVVCFSLGSWVGGMYTTLACRHLAEKGYPLTLVTPGNNRVEILRVVRALSPHFEQLVLFGYPPFLKDVIDAGRADGFAWDEQRVGLVTAGEVFSETWRSLVAERLGARDPAPSVASLYGTADGGVLANETPLSIRIRRFLAERPAAARELFGESRLPTLCQYDPLHRYFEQDGNELVFSGDGSVPLLRYRILDRGGVLPFSTLVEFVRDHGGDPLAPAPFDISPARELPFVFVFGRSGFALSFYGANVYPENVALGLEQPELTAHVTGKFVMQLMHDREEDVELEVVVELGPQQAASSELAARVARLVRRELELQNSEFLHYAPAERRTPRVRLLPFGDPDYFPAGVKHRSTR